jgi:large repetitive protein
VDTVVPAAPVVGGITTDTGTAGDGITSDNTLIVKGTAEASSIVTVYRDGNVIGTATANGSGVWSFDSTGTSLVDGTYSFTAVAKDAAGNTSAASAAFVVKVDTVAPVAPVVGGITTDTGTAGDGITSDKTLVLSGTAEANSTVTVYKGGTSMGTATAGSTGVWSFDYTGTSLADGTYSFTAKAKDTAGNTSAASAALAVKVDTAAPAAPAVKAIADDTGTAGDKITSDNSLILSGTAEANSTVTLYRDGGSIGTTTASSTGAWSCDYTGTTLTDGTYSFTAKAKDAAGNTSAASAAFVVQIDTVAPTAVLSWSNAVSEGTLGYVEFQQPSDPSATGAAAGFWYSYDFDNDGIFDLVNVTSATVAIPTSYFAEGPGFRTVRARIADQAGGFTDYVATVSIANAPPTVTLAKADPALVGTPFLGSGCFKDLGLLDTWMATVDYGDGSGTQPLTLNPDNTFALNRTYPHPGTYTITVRVTDDDGGVGVATESVAVSAPSPEVQAVVNEGAAQRSMVTSITYTFNTPVTLAANAFELTRADGLPTDTTLVASNLSNDRRTYVLTFTGTSVVNGSLADGSYTLRLYAERVQDDYGQTLSGGDSVLSFHRLFGDSDGDRDTDTTNLLAFRTSLGQHQGDAGYLSYFDYNGDGVVDSSLDYVQFRLRLGKMI